MILVDMIRLIQDDEEFKLKAYSFYDNPQAISIKEFKDDLKRFRYVKGLIEKYQVAYSGNRKLINERLILNHLIVLHNLFGEFTSLGLFSKVEPEFWGVLKTFLKFMDYMPKCLDPEDKIATNKEIEQILKDI